MATSERGPVVADDAVTRLDGAEFVTLDTISTSDGIVATAMLVQAFRTLEIPFHVRLGPASAGATGDPVRLRTRAEDPDAGIDLSTPATSAAIDAIEQLEATVDPVLAAVGQRTWEGTTDTTSDLGAELTDGPGVGLATADVPEALGHSTRLRGPWSGADPSAALPDGIDNDGELASIVAVDTLGTCAVPERVVPVLEGVFQPVSIPDGPFETAGGFAEIVTVLSATAPGLALATACAPAVYAEEALTAWQTGAATVHDRVAAGPDEDDGEIAIYREAGAVAPIVARLARTFEVAAPSVIATDATITAVAATPAQIDRLLADPPAGVETWKRHRPGVVSTGDEVGSDDFTTAVRRRALA